MRQSRLAIFLVIDYTLHSTALHTSSKTRKHNAAIYLATYYELWVAIDFVGLVTSGERVCACAMYSTHIYIECVRLWKIVSIEANALPYNASDNDSEISTGIHNIRLLYRMRFLSFSVGFFSLIPYICRFGLFGINWQGVTHSTFRLWNLHSLYLICLRFHFDTNILLYTYYKQRFYILKRFYT